MSDQEKVFEVGYGKPPKNTRFKKGASGNPNGRPKGAKGFIASLKRELESTVTVREGNRKIRIPKAEALAKRLVEKALKGEMVALKMLAQFDANLSEQVEQEAKQSAILAELDRTDEAILQHFSSQLDDECFDPEGSVEPWLPEDREEDQ